MTLYGDGTVHLGDSVPVEIMILHGTKTHVCTRPVQRKTGSSENNRTWGQF